MLLNQIKSFIEPYLTAKQGDISSKFDSPSFGIILGRNLVGTPFLETTLSLVGGGECTAITVRELVVRIHPLSLLAIRAKNLYNEDDAGFSLELRGVRAVFRAKGEEWRRSKGDTETLDMRLGVNQALRLAIHDSLILEQAQHDTYMSSTVKWLTARVSGNIRIEISDLEVDLFPVNSVSEKLTMRIDEMLLANSNDDPCANQGFGHVQGPSVTRKQLTINNLNIHFAKQQDPLFAVNSAELLVAANLSSEGKGLCTAVEIRFAESTTVLMRESVARVNHLLEGLNKGKEVEQKSQDALSVKLGKMQPLSADDLTRMRVSYERILQSDNPDADTDLTKQLDNKELAFAHSLSWLQLKELQIGEHEVNKMLQNAADAVRSQRAFRTRTAAASSASSKHSSTGEGSLSVVESLSLLQQDPSRARLVFESLDLDKSGTIDVIEMQRGLENCGLNLGTDRLLALMSEIEGTSTSSVSSGGKRMSQESKGADDTTDFTITFDQFKRFLQKVNDKHALSTTEPGKAEVVSVAVVLYFQRLTVTLDKYMEFNMVNSTLAALSSGMPYYRRHDYTVGMKRVKMSCEYVGATCNIAPNSLMPASSSSGNSKSKARRLLLSWGNVKQVDPRVVEDDGAVWVEPAVLSYHKKGVHKKKSIASQTSLRFVEVRLPPESASALTAGTSQQDEFAGGNSALRFGADYLVDGNRYVKKSSTSEPYQSKDAKWEKVNEHAFFEDSPPFIVERVAVDASTGVGAVEEFVEIKLIRGKKMSTSFIGRIFSNSDSERKQPDQVIGIAMLRLEKGSSGAIEFSSKKRQLRTFERWVQLTDPTTGNFLGEVLVRTRMEAWHVEKEEKEAEDDGISSSKSFRNRQSSKRSFSSSSTEQKDAAPGDYEEELNRGIPVAFALDLVHSPGIRINDLGLKLDMHPLELYWTREAEESMKELTENVFKEPKPEAATAPLPAMAMMDSDEAYNTSLYVPPSTDGVNAQQQSSPGDLFGFTTVLNSDPTASTVPALLRATVSLNLFGMRDKDHYGSFVRLIPNSKIISKAKKQAVRRKNAGQEVLAWVEMLATPCSFNFETNRGCSSQVARFLGFQKLDVEDAIMDGGNVEVDSAETRSVGGESFTTAVDGDLTDDEGASRLSQHSAPLNREFHGSFSLEEHEKIEFQITKMSCKFDNVASHSEPQKQHHSSTSSPVQIDRSKLCSFIIVKPMMFINSRLDPTPSADFEFRVQEILLVDWTIAEIQPTENAPSPSKQPTPQRLLCRYLARNDDQYNFGDMLLIRGSYGVKETKGFVNFDGFCFLITPTLRLVAEVMQFTNSPSPDSVSVDNGQSNSAQAVTQPQQETLPSSPVDFATTMILPTESINGKLSLNRIELYISESAKLETVYGKTRVLCLKSHCQGTLAVASEQGSAKPLYEKLDLAYEGEVIRMDLKRSFKSPQSQLVDPFRMSFQFHTTKNEPMHAVAFAQVVETAIARRLRNENEDDQPDLPAVCEYVQDIVLELDGGISSRMDTSDFRFCSRALEKLAETSAMLSNETSPPPASSSTSPVAQSSAAGNGSSPTVWTIMNALNPMLVLAPAEPAKKNRTSSGSGAANNAPKRSDHNKKVPIVDVRKQLYEDAGKAFKDSSTSGPPLQRLQVKFAHFLFGLGVVNENGLPTPFIRAHLAELLLSLESDSGTWFAKDVSGSGKLGLDCYAFNTISYAWEPLVEPWSMEFRVRRLPSEETLISAFSNTRLNLNVTESVVFNANRFSEFTDPSVKPPSEDVRLKGSYCPNWLINETGETLEIWPVRGEVDRVENQRGSSQSDVVLLDSNKVSKIHLKDRRALFEAGDRLVQKYVSAELKRARLAKQPQPSINRREVLKRIFRLIDRDGNGRLSLPELQRALSTQNELIPRDQLNYEVECAIGKPMSEGISEEDFSEFFNSDPTDTSTGKKFPPAVSALAVRLPLLANANENYFLAPAQLTGVYVLPLAKASFNKDQKPGSHQATGTEVFAVVEKMGRLVTATVLRLETRIRIENRLLGYVLQMGYYSNKNPSASSATATVVVQDKSPSSSSSPLRDLGMSYFKRLTGSSNSPTVEETKKQDQMMTLPQQQVSDGGGTGGKVFEVVFEVPSGESECIPLRYFRSNNVTDFFFRLIPQVVVDTQSKTEEEKKDIDEEKKLVPREIHESPNFISVGQNNPDAPFHRIRMKKNLQVPDPEMTTSILKIKTRPEDYLEAELVDERLVRADRVLFGNNREFICSERVIPSYQFFAKPVLTCQIVLAKNVMASDMNGLSDPYVVVDAGSEREKFRTPTAYQTLEPHWPGDDSTFRIGENSDQFPAQITISVFDEDKFTQHDLLGSITLDTDRLIKDLLDDVGECTSAVRTYPLTDPLSNKTKSSRLLIAWKYEKSAQIKVPSDTHQRVVAFCHSILLENLLPINLEIELRNADSPTAYRYEIGSGNSCYPEPFFDGAMVGTPKVFTRIRVASSPSDRSPTASESNELNWTEVKDLDKAFLLHTKKSTYIINADLLREKDGTRRLIFFADFWVANKTGLGYELDFELTASAIQMPEKKDEAAESTSTSLTSLVQSSTNIRTKRVSEKEICCICVPKSQSNNDRRDVMVRAHMQLADSSQSVELVSVDPRKAKRLLLHPKPLDLEDSKVQADDGQILLQGETKGFLGQSSNYLAEDINLSENLFGSLCLVVREFKQQPMDQQQEEEKTNLGDDRNEGSDLGDDSTSNNRSPKKIRSVKLIPLTSPSSVVGADPDLMAGSQRRLVSMHASHSSERSDGAMAPSSSSSAKEFRKVDKEHYMLDDLKKLGESTGMARWENWTVEITLEDADIAENEEHQTWRIGLRQFVTGVANDQYETWGFLDSAMDDSLCAEPTANTWLEIGSVLHNSLPRSVASTTSKVDPQQRQHRVIAEQFAVGATSLYGKWWRTRLLTFAPNFTVACDETLGVKILAKPYGVSDSEAVLLEKIPKGLRMCDVANPRVQFRVLSNPHAAWTRPVPLMHEHDFSVQLRDIDGNRVVRVFLDMNRSGPSRCIVIRDCSDEMTRVLVRNNTSESVWIRQVPRPPKRGWREIITCVPTPRNPLERESSNGPMDPRLSKSGTGNAIFPLDEIKSGEFLPLGFDIFDDVANPVDTDDNEYVHSPRLMIYTDATKSRATKGIVCKLREGFRANSDRVAMAVHTEGAHMVVDIEHGGRQVNHSSSSSSLQLSRKTSSDHDRGASALFKGAKGGTSIAVQMAGVGLSLFSTTRKSEVLYCILQRIHFETSFVENVEKSRGNQSSASASSSNSSEKLWTNTKMELSVAKIQVDSSLTDARYPVALTSDLKVRQERRKRVFTKSLQRAGHVATPEQQHHHPHLPGSKRHSQPQTPEPPPSCVSEEMERWAPKLCGPEFRLKRAQESFLRLVTHSSSPVAQPEVVVYKQIELTFKPMDVRIDEVFLGGMLGVLLAQADAQAFSKSLGEDIDNIAAEVRKTLPADALLVQNCFHGNMITPLRDSSFVELSAFSEWAMTLSVRLGSPDELIPLAKRYGLPVNVLVIGMRLARLEAFLFNVPSLQESAIGSEKIMTKYNSLLMSAFWQQLGEIVLNFGKRLLISAGIMRGLAQNEKIRTPPEQGNTVSLYGPGRHPLPTEQLIEANAVLRIEAWWQRRKEEKERANGSLPPPTVFQSATGRASKLLGLVRSAQTKELRGDKRKHKTMCGC